MTKVTNVHTKYVYRPTRMKHVVWTRKTRLWN